MNYKCIKCNKEFHQKSNYEVHIRRKYSCNKNYNQEKDINNNKLLSDHNESIIHHNASIMNHNESIMNHNIISNNIINDKQDLCIDINADENNLQCEFCEKFFTHKTNLTRHIKLYCKNKKLNETTNSTIIALLEQNKQIIDELDKLKKSDEMNKLQINNLKEENNELKQLTTMSKVSKAKTTNSHNTNNTNTVSINSNNTNNIQNIFSVNFG